MLVRKIDSVWRQWNGVNESIPKTVNTRTELYLDGRVLTGQTCEPYTLLTTLTAAVVEQHFSEEEMADFGIKKAVNFVIPDGMQRVAGSEDTFEEREGKVYQVVKIEKSPPKSDPEPEPKSEFQAISERLDMLAEHNKLLEAEVARLKETQVKLSVVEGKEKV